MLYDSTDRQSFQDLYNMVNFLGNQIEGVCIHIVGTKTDLAHVKVVQSDEVASYAKSSGHFFTEVSSFSGKGVEKAFSALMEEIVDLLKSKNVILRS